MAKISRQPTNSKKQPELKLLVQTARDARPSPEEVRRVCQELRAKDATITATAVARALGRGRKTPPDGLSRLLHAREPQHQQRPALRQNDVMLRDMPQLSCPSSNLTVTWGSALGAPWVLDEGVRAAWFCLAALEGLRPRAPFTPSRVSSNSVV